MSSIALRIVGPSLKSSKAILRVVADGVENITNPILDWEGLIPTSFCTAFETNCKEKQHKILGNI